MDQVQQQQVQQNNNAAAYPLIYPETLRKYSGSVWRIKRGYRAKIKTPQFTQKSTFPDAKSAESWVRIASIANNLPIKNIIEDRGDHLGIRLKQGVVTPVESY